MDLCIVILTRSGALLTTGALTYATVQLRRGNRNMFQRALRYRVAFQTITVVAAAASLFYLRKPKSRVPEEPGPDGKPQQLMPWNPEKQERRDMENEAEWRSRFAGAQTRHERENAAIERMVQEAIARREQAAKELAAANATASPTSPEPTDTSQATAAVPDSKDQQNQSLLARLDKTNVRGPFSL